MKITLISNHGKYESAFAETECSFFETDETCIAITFPEESVHFMDFIQMVNPEVRFFEYNGKKVCFLDPKDFSAKIFP